MNHYLIHDRPIGALVLNFCSDFLLSISFKSNHLFKYNNSCLNGKNLVLEKKVKELDEYFFNNRTFSTIKYTLITSPFFKRAPEKFSLIQYGIFKSYKRVARSLRIKKAYRAVANPNANNPLPTLISCHRLIKASGELGVYRGRIGHKKYLLNLEKKTGNFH